MELDKRILPGKRPLGCFDTEAAKEFIGKEGYFCRYEHLFSDANKIGSTSVLAQIKPKDPAPFVPQIAINRDQSYGYEYFLPAEWLKREEPECMWRPYLINEWLQEYDFGDVIKFRTKTNNHCEITAIFTGYDLIAPNCGPRIMLGCNAYSLDLLFEHYDLLDKTNDGKSVWRPFGVEEASE